MANEVNGHPILYRIGPYRLLVTSGADPLVMYQPETSGVGQFNWIPAGATTVTKALTAVLSFTSAQTRKAKKLLTASWSGTGSLARRTTVFKSLTGAVTFTSAQPRKASKPLNATLLSSSANIRRVRKFTAAAGPFTGSLTKRVRKTLTASLGFSGALTQVDVPVAPYSPPGMTWIQRWRRKRRN